MLPYAFFRSYFAFKVRVHHYKFYSDSQKRFKKYLKGGASYFLGPFLADLIVGPALYVLPCQKGYKRQEKTKT